jgi:hypothetical protein
MLQKMNKSNLYRIIRLIIYRFVYQTLFLFTFRWEHWFYFENSLSYSLPHVLVGLSILSDQSMSPPVRPTLNQRSEPIKYTNLKFSRLSFRIFPGLFRSKSFCGLG